ncbi:GNAT family N-acetyltransferase [Sphingomonas changnyeongensis]|uniref:GNAT family N-acetyltransferase n=1 Tax=Sphingomonas changnyeongensis TaxID=2698679 RepID=A0A7Z2S866_9SPHN|nr:GNAT family N-acetyltransferase [Sphingomonas changnyeongensis]QHL91081.1 GNAT family N-acetyltransferase [Sphingomonas changnyeongensis]
MWVKGEYYDSLGPVETIARGALGASARPWPFDRLDWLKAAAAGLDAPPLIVRARSEGVDGWLMLAPTGRGRFRTLGADHAHRTAPIFTGPADGMHRRRLLRAIATRLRGAALGVTEIALGPLDRADAGEVARAFSRCGWVVAARALPPRWRSETAGHSFDDYWDARSQSLRTRIERAAARAPLDLEVSTVLSPALWDELAQLTPEADGPFHHFAAAESAAGTLRLAVARCGDTPIAAQLWTVSHGMAVAHLLAQSRAHKALSPGAQLAATMVRYLTNVDHVDAIEWVPGHGWCAEWAEQAVPRVALRLLNPRRAAAWPATALALMSGGLTSSLVRRPALD